MKLKHSVFKPVPCKNKREAEAAVKQFKKQFPRVAEYWQNLRKDRTDVQFTQVARGT